MRIERRSFLATLLSLAARGLALLGGSSLVGGCPGPVKYGGPPPQPVKYGGPPEPASQPASSQPAPKVKAATKYGGRPTPKVAPEYGVRVQPSRPPPSGTAPEYGIRRQPPASERLLGVVLAVFLLGCQGAVSKVTDGQSGGDRAAGELVRGLLGARNSTPPRR